MSKKKKWELTIRVTEAAEAWALIQQLGDLGKNITVRRIETREQEQDEKWVEVL